MKILDTGGAVYIGYHTCVELQTLNIDMVWNRKNSFNFSLSLFQYI